MTDQPKDEYEVFVDGELVATANVVEISIDQDREANLDTGEVIQPARGTFAFHTEDG